MEQLPVWRFRVLDPAYPKWDPVEAEFFAEEGAPEALVREAIQNSLDAAVDDVVRVRFAFGSAEEGHRYLAILPSHLEKIDVVETEDTELEGPLDYLVIEDFGTKGLTGDHYQVRDDQADAEAGKNNFYYFWRNIGRSAKQEEDIGRWGLGKRVFPSSSRIYSFFGLTRRADHKDLLMGQSVLKTHYLHEEEYFPYGYFAVFSERGVPLPVEEAGWINDFRGVFGLERTEETGLSIVIPKPKEHITAEALQKAVLRHYFYPLIEGRLMVEVVSDVEKTELSGETIDAAVEALDWAGEDVSAAEVKALFDFVRRVQSTNGNAGSLKLLATGETSAAKWTPELVDETTGALIRERLHAGEMVAVSVPVFVKAKGRDPAESEFGIFLERVDNSRYGDLYFLRRGITIPGAGRWRRRDVRALVVVGKGALSTLLGDSETPAHTDWIASAERIKREYYQGYSVVQFVKQSVSKLLDLVAQADTEVDRDWLQDVFSLPENTGQTPDDRPARKRRTTVPDPKPERRPSLFQISHLQGGFAIRGNPDVAPESFTVRTAYDLPGRNPFKAWSEFDFRLGEGDIKLTADGCTVEEIEGNRLTVVPSSSGFDLQVTGFDARRDLRVDARRVSS